MPLLRILLISISLLLLFRPALTAFSFCPGRIITIANRKSTRTAQDDGITRLLFRKGSLTQLVKLSNDISGESPTWVEKIGRSLVVTNAVTPNATLTLIRAQERRKLPTYFRSSSAQCSATAATHISFVNGVVVVANFGGSVDTFRARRRLQRLDSFVVPTELASINRNPTLTRPFDAPHPHMAFPYKDGVLVPDLGSDLVFYLRVKRDGTLSEISRTRFTPGDGPRHVVIGARGKVYVVTEISLNLVVMEARGKRFKLVDRRELLDSLPADGSARPKAAGIRLSNDKRFLYISVRYAGVNGRIVGFQLNSAGNVVRKVGEWDSHGVHPRDFVLVEDYCGSWLLVANRDSDNIAVLQRNSRTGKIERCVERFTTNTPFSVAVLLGGDS